MAGQAKTTDFESIFNDRYKKLNKAQRKAVDTVDGPLLVVAGPGSGKTEILSMRVAQILRTTQAFPSNILCLTFTDSAAQNMRERLARLIGDRAYQVSIHTFHNFCVDIIRKYGEFFYHSATFTPADPVTQIDLLERIFNKMDHDNPLKAYHPEMGYSFLKSAQSAIGHVKKSGLRPVELKAIVADNEVVFDQIESIFVPVINSRIGKGTLDELRAALALFSKKQTLREHNEEVKKLFSIFHPLEESFALSVAEVIAKCEASGKNESLSEWKKKWFPKDDAGNHVFRDRLQLKKIYTFINVYQDYQSELYRRGYFDFDDMILDVISALGNEPRLMFELQEQYQYLLVDEFQDTNNAQMRILSLLTSAAQHEGKPNIMVVGDDDQAIYKFQGAELSNILDFRHRFTDVELVTMTENYRSTQDILNLSMSIIRKGEKRLENLIPDLSKELVSRSLAADNIVEYSEHETSLHEYKFVSNKIKSLIDAGVSPNDIAVIARTHGTLEEFVPFMKLAQVPLKYEREQSVFAEPHIRELITMMRFISSGINTEEYIAVRDDLLPEILSFAFWNVPRIDIWKISLAARRDKKTWLEVMHEYDSQQIRDIALFFINLSVDSKSLPLERVIDKLVGAHIKLTPDTTDQDEDQETVAGEIATALEDGKIASKEFISPFKDYYFSNERFTHARAEYLTFLSSLRVFINSLRSFNGFESDSAPAVNTVSDSALATAGDSSAQNSAHASNRFRILYASDLIRFVDVYEKNGLKLNDESPFITARSAVQLMSAHKSKGLEFRVVFVLSCQDDEWASRSHPSKISFPMNLPIEPAGDSEDDQLRLFYVALTRAREQLYLTSHQVKDSGKPASILRFLVDLLPTIKTGADTLGAGATAGEGSAQLDIGELLETAATSYHTAPFIDTEEALLAGLIENYKLSVTHLNNYLNIPKGGPRLFFEQNLLRFPQSKSLPGSYGSAIHATLEYVLNDLKKNHVLPKIDDMLQTFELFLKKEKMHPNDFRIHLRRGQDALRVYFNQKAGEFSETDIPEYDFAREHILISDDHENDGSGEGTNKSLNESANEKVFITGKIDKVTITDDRLVVYDYKTGRAFDSFESPKSDEALKVHQYKNQLLFYKLLLENSVYVASHADRNGQNDEKAKLYGKKVVCGTIDFIEPVTFGGSVLGDADVDSESESGRSKKRIQSTSLILEDEEVDRLKRLCIAVYRKIKALEFDIPKEIAEQNFKNDFEAVQAFENYLLGE